MRQRDREIKKREREGGLGNRRKEDLVSFILQNAFFSHSTFDFFVIYSLLSSHSLLRFVPFPLSLFHLCVTRRLWGESPWDFPTVQQDRPNPTPTHFLSFPPLPPFHVGVES